MIARCPQSFFFSGAFASFQIDKIKYPRRAAE